MGIKILNAVLGATWSDGVQSQTELIDGVEDLQGGNFDQGHMATSVSVVQVQSTPLSGPSVGHLRVDTSTTPPTYREYNGSSEIPIGGGDYLTTIPTYTVEGLRWWHPTLKEWTVYKTVDGISGFHPESPGIQLMHSRSATALAPGSVVIRDTTGVSNREFTSTIIRKHHDVIGVMLGKASDVVLTANVATTDVAYVALNQCGAVVNVRVPNSGLVTKGQMLATYTTAGVAEATGSAFGSSYTLSSGITQLGFPMGAFAEAIGTTTSTLTRARLLGFVGNGATRFEDGLNTIVDIGDLVSGTELIVDVTAPPSGSAISSADSPIVGVWLQVELEGDGGAGDTPVETDFYIESFQDIIFQVSMKGRGDANGLVRNTYGPFFVPTCVTGSTVTPGNTFVVRYANVTGTATVVNVRLTARLY